LIVEEDTMAKRSGHGTEMARFHRCVASRDDRDLPGEEIDLSLGSDGSDLERIVQDDIVAELDAHGTEVARLHRHVPSPEDPDFAGEETQFSLRSDGYVLVRRVLRWRDGDPERDGWRLHSRIRAATTAERRERIAVVFPKVIRHLTGKGFSLRQGPVFFETRDQLREGD
jgi:hypothetical protein